MSSERDGMARSVQVRLARHAKSIGVDPNLVLTRYAIERFLYRLSRSPYCERFVLKGALLMLAWMGDTLRPTRDADLLGFGDLTMDALARIFVEICTVPVEGDAMNYQVDSVRVEPIRFEDAYGGDRVTLTAILGAARLRVQVDVGVGDIVVPAPNWLDYPSLLELPRPRLRAYGPESVIAEKLHAIVVLGSRNSRMKDFFDLYALAKRGNLNADAVGEAIAATFQRRDTVLPADWPIGLSEAFSGDAAKRQQWRAFLGKNRLQAPELDSVNAEIRRFIGEPLIAARKRAEHR
jgi:predicted nucleotidyltransferase component of viral defense system